LSDSEERREEEEDSEPKGLDVVSLVEASEVRLSFDVSSVVVAVDVD
jgi:hypothetical protein